MLSKIKTVFIVLVCVAAVIGIARFSHHATKGFRLSKVQFSSTNEDPIACAEIDRQFIAALSHQKFHYLGRGLQSFVFESEDKQYVLKLFNNRYQRNISLLSLLSYFPPAEKWALAKMRYFQGKLEKTFHSYQIAFEEMKEKTGLLYAHLSPTTNLPSTFTIVDPLNICHEINLNQMGFLIQKKATLIYPALNEYLQNEDTEGAKKALASLVDLFFWKWDQGIADNDPLIRTNYGIAGGEVIQLDVGPLSRREAPMDLEEQRQEISKITASLKFWLNENAPQLAAYLDQELEQHLLSEECIEEPQPLF